ERLWRTVDEGCDRRRRTDLHRPVRALDPVEPGTAEEQRPLGTDPTELDRRYDERAAGEHRDAAAVAERGSGLLSGSRNDDVAHAARSILVDQRPSNFGLRFSPNASTPSRKSSVARSRPSAKPSISSPACSGASYTVFRTRFATASASGGSSASSSSSRSTAAPSASGATTSVTSPSASASSAPMRRPR